MSTTWLDDYEARLQKEIEMERQCRAAVVQMIEDNLPLIRAAWNWGDGQGGWILSEMAQRVGIVACGSPKKPQKAKINGTLRRQVFERDAYRCVSCGGYQDLCIDHIVPESKGGPTVFENLQAMCRSCNSKKGARA